MHNTSSEQAAPRKGNAERKQLTAGIPFLSKKLGTASLLLLILGGGALRAEERSEDVGLLFGSEMATLAQQSLQDLQEKVDRAQEQLAVEVNAREEAQRRRDEAQQLKVARQRRLETKAKSYRAEIIAEANVDRLESMAQEMAALEQKVAEAEEELNQAEREIASLDSSINAAEEASQELQEKVNSAREVPVLALEERAPNVVRYLAPYSSLVVNRRNLILLLKPGVTELDLSKSLPWDLRVLETLRAGSRQALLVERTREAGELNRAELPKLEGNLRDIVGTGKVEEILADPLLFGADAYADSDACMQKVISTRTAAPQDPCVKAAVRLRLPISLALLKRPTVVGQLGSVKLGILDVGFTVPGPLIENTDEHGDLVKRVLDFALGEWQVQPPLNIDWIRAAAPGKTVKTSSGSLNGVQLPKSLSLLNDLGDSGVRVVNVSLGANEFLLSEKALETLFLNGRAQGYQQMIDGYAKISKNMFVASAAGNDASCWKGYKATWSSPLNTSQVHAIQVVAQLKPSFDDVDEGSNSVEPNALLMTPSGTTKRTCIGAKPVAQVQTSFATPYVSAIATIVAAILPQADGSTIRSILRETTNDRVPDALAATLCALNRRGINPWLALGDTNGDGAFGPDDRVALLSGSTEFGAIYGGADLNGNGVVGGPAQRRMFGVDLSDGDLMDIAAGLRAAPALPVVCQLPSN